MVRYAQFIPRLAIAWLLSIPLTGQMFAQESSPLQQRITLSLAGHSLADAFEMIQQATGLSFTYGAHYIPEATLEKDFKKVRLRRVLDELLEGAGLAYKVEGTHIVVYPLKEARPPAQLTISGYIRDAASGEELIGSYVFAGEMQTGVASNSYGFYSLTVPEGPHTLQVRYLGYEHKDTTLVLTQNQHLDIRLRPGVQQLQPIVINASASKGMEAEEPPPMGKEIEMDMINEMPGLLGEQDVLQSLQLLPGVTPSGEAVGSLSIRGGASDQNLYLLDEAPVFYDSHMSGFFSIFNPDVVKHVRLYKNHIPAKYQGRLASVIDIRTAEGNTERIRASGGVGLIASRLKVEGPLLNQKANFLIAARRSHLEIYAPLYYSGEFSAGIRNFFSFTDLNAKTSLRLGAKSRVFLSGYYGQDLSETKFSSKNPYPLGTRASTEWGNKTLTLRWNYLFNSRLFQNTSVIYHDFRYQFRESIQDSTFVAFLKIRAPMETTINGFQVKSDFQYYQAPGSVIRFGAGLVFNRFGHLRADMPEAAGTDDSIQRRSRTAGLYAAHEWEPHKRVAIDYGVHLTQFTALGTDSHVYRYSGQGARIDSTYYGAGQSIRTYYGIEPRVSISYALKERHWLTVVYNRNYQYVQRISRPIPNDPVNIWLPSDQLIRPQYSGHWSVEYTAGIGNGAYEASLGFYYKKMQNQPGFRGGATLEGRPPADLESLLVFGTVKAKGVECLLRKNVGQFRAWASYTFSAAEAHFDQIDSGRPFPTDVLRPHVLSLAAVWDVNDKMAVVGRWVYLSGKSLTLPVGTYSIDGAVLDYYAPRNAFRLEADHRFDLSITVYRKGLRDRGTSLNLSLFNLYSRRNPSYVYLKQEPDGTTKTYQVSLTPFITPSLAYNFRF